MGGNQGANHRRELVRKPNAHLHAGHGLHAANSGGPSGQRREGISGHPLPGEAHDSRPGRGGASRCDLPGPRGDHSRDLAPDPSKVCRVLLGCTLACDQRRDYRSDPPVLRHRPGEVPGRDRGAARRDPRAGEAEPPGDRRRRIPGGLRDGHRCSERAPRSPTSGPAGTSRGAGRETAHYLARTPHRSGR